MRTKFAISAAVALSALTAFPAAAEAQSYRGGYYDNSRNHYRGYDRRDDRRYYNQRYYNQRQYDRRYRSHYGQRCSGSTGTILGAIAGGLIGREVAGRGDRTIGTIIGGAAGALAGRSIDRSDCRR